ncbi:MAG: amino acid--tRNA ligase-related protein, partial [Thermomicrobiales bacterium]
MEPAWLRLRSAPEQRRAYLMRGRIIKAIRAFFDAQGFEEVETPLLVAAPGMEPYLDVFETRLTTARGQSSRAFLTTSPEYAMKKLLVAGLPRIYQICKSFRNGEEISRGHNPEFTILEWYRADTDYRAIMVDCENLLMAIWRAIHADAAPDAAPVIAIGNDRVTLAPPWERLTVRDAFDRFANLDLDAVRDTDAMRRLLGARGYQVSDSTTWEQGYHQIFLNEIEPRLGRTQPTILHDYPASMAALARRKADDPRYAERFEFYLRGIEL